MKTIDHKLLANELIEEFMPKATRLSKKAFYLGCIEPDYNPLSYLRGSLKAKWLRGHHHDNSKWHIDSLSKALERAKEHSKNPGKRYYFRLGKLIHYMTDAFTFSHNSVFPGDLSEHRQYEMKLHFSLPTNEFIKSYCENMQLRFKELTDWHKLHNAYLKHKMDVENDLKYIRHVTCELMYRLCGEIGVPQPSKLHS